MKDKTPIVILIFLFIIFGFVYKPVKDVGKKEDAQKQTASRNTSSSSIGTNEQSNLQYNSNKTLAEQIKKIERDLGKIERNIVSNANKGLDGTKSPYFGKVKMSNITGVRQNDPSREYLTLRTNLKIDETINITGWYLQSGTTRYYAIIGRASTLPFPNTKNETDIFLQKGDRVIITKGFSPIGISFRLNKCTGYFEENRTFYPSLPLQCPRTRDMDLPNFSPIPDRNDECMTIIERVGRCRTVDNEFIRDLPDTVTESCKSFMKAQINYNSCVARHFGDTDFPGNTYRVYLGKFGPLWREKNETINLHDENGLIVDTISY